jgi:hypothetical protein
MESKQELQTDHGMNTYAKRTKSQKQSTLVLTGPQIHCYIVCLLLAVDAFEDNQISENNEKHCPGPPLSFRYFANFSWS